MPAFEVPDQFKPAAPVAATPSRQKVERLEAFMRGCEQADIPTTHTSGPGSYARTVHIKAGVIATGKVHATEHVLMLTKGRALIVTDGGAYEAEAPHQCVCAPGTKKAVLALSDCEITNVHANADDCRDLSRLEASLIEPGALPAPQMSEALQ